MQPPPPPSPVQPAGPARTGSRLLGIVGVILGLAGLVAGVAAWFRAGPPREAAVPAYSEQQVIDAKTAVCEAYEKGLRSLHVAGGKKADPADWLPVAVNTRLAETAMGSYLVNVLDLNPATPRELRGLMQQLAVNYQEMAVIQLSDAPTSDFEANGRVADEIIPKIDPMCQ